jgi:hypothetical protein
MGVVYNTTAPTATNGQQVALQGDVNGKLQTVANLGATVYVQSTGNNTSTQLASGLSFSGTTESALSYPNLILSVRCDQPYTINIDQFSDLAGTIQYSPSIVYTRLAGVAFNQSISIAGSYYRVRITNNGGATTTTLFAESWLGILHPLPQLDNNGNLPVTIQNSGSSSNASVDTTITLGGTAQTLIVANANRKYLVIQNTGTLDLRIKFGGTASATVGFILKPDSSYTTDIMGVYTGAISVFGTTTNQPYSYWEV